MTATIVHRRRPWAPVLNMLVALSALVIAVLALADAPDAVNNELTRPPSAQVAVDAGPANPSAPNRIVIDGCDRARGIHPC